MARDLFSVPDPFKAVAFAQPRSTATTARDRLAHVIAAYSREFLLTSPNVQFLRHMLDRGALDEMACSTVLLSEWADYLSLSMGQYYRYECDYAAQLQAAVGPTGRWPWAPPT